MNGGLPRLDLSVDALRRARERDVTFVLTSDAHHARELARVDYAALNAERAWVDPERVANTWPAERLARGRSAEAATVRDRHVLAGAAALRSRSRSRTGIGPQVGAGWLGRVKVRRPACSVAGRSTARVRRQPEPEGPVGSR